MESKNNKNSKENELMLRNASPNDHVLARWYKNDAKSKKWTPTSDVYYLPANTESRVGGGGPRQRLVMTMTRAQTDEEVQKASEQAFRGFDHKSLPNCVSRAWTKTGGSCVVRYDYKQHDKKDQTRTGGVSAKPPAGVKCTPGTVVHAVQDMEHDLFTKSGGGFAFNPLVNSDPSSWPVHSVAGYELKSVPFTVKNASPNETFQVGFYKADESILCRTQCIKHAVRLSHEIITLAPGQVGSLNVLADTGLITPGTNLYLIWVPASSGGLSDDIASLYTIPGMKKMRIQLGSIPSMLKFSDNGKTVTSQSGLSVMGGGDGDGTDDDDSLSRHFTIA